MQKLILATNNQGKINEISALLQPIVCLLQQSLSIPEITETGLSFVENAIIKARHASKICKLPALADDSGLVVPALNGEPGIYSARFAKSKKSSLSNIDYLLHCLANTKERDRNAYFYCALALVKDANDPIPLIITATWDGKIAFTQKGTQGFGYDPVFYLPDLHLTAAELSLEQKNVLSHRAKALQKLKVELLGQGPTYLVS